MPQAIITALYHFVILENFKELRQPLLELLLENDIKGTLLLARGNTESDLSSCMNTNNH